MIAPAARTLPPDPSVDGLWWMQNFDAWYVWWWDAYRGVWQNGQTTCSARDAHALGWRCMFPAAPPIPPNAQPIATAPQDGSTVMVYAAAFQDLNPIICQCAWHPDAGWCVDELRSPTLWWPIEGSYGDN